MIKIAIVDDCRGVRDMIGDLLVSVLGDNIRIDKIGGKDCISELEDPNLENLLEYDLILIDEALCGYRGSTVIKKLTELAIERNKDIPCTIFITGFPSEVLIDRLTDLDLAGKLTCAVLEKPFKVEEFYKSIYAVCPRLASLTKQKYRTPKWGESLSSMLTIFSPQACTNCE